ncbi:MAG TPA: winged helix DNA-binding protein [Rhodanobacteraceae bacterium]|nr:winged helix DNA-binding protein [Rhodanobacteraceae bacterium]
MNDFIHSQGLIFLPHILRRLANRFIDACDELFPAFDIVVPPRMVSLVHLLHDGGPRSVTDIAAAIGQSHPFVIKSIRQLKELALVDTMADPKDKRRTIVSLTPEGTVQAQRLIDARLPFVAAYRELMRETDAEVFDALWRLEGALRKTTFADRIVAARKRQADTASTGANESNESGQA